MPLSAKFSAIAAVTGAVAASAAIGRLAASMLDTAITSSIRNIISVFDVTSGLAGWIRIAVQHRPYSRSSSTNRVRHLRVAVSEGGSARKRAQLRMMTTWMQSMPQVHAAAEIGCIQNAEQQAGRDHQQHHDIGRRHPGLGVLPEQFAVEGRAGSAGRR